MFEAFRDGMSVHRSALADLAILRAHGHCRRIVILRCHVRGDARTKSVIAHDSNRTALDVFKFPGLLVNQSNVSKAMHVMSAGTIHIRNYRTR